MAAFGCYSLPYCKVVGHAPGIFLPITVLEREVSWLVSWVRRELKMGFFAQPVAPTEFPLYQPPTPMSSASLLEVYASWSMANVEVKLAEVIEMREP